MSKGLLLIISGFSGSGKGTIVKELLARSDDYVLSVSATTRAPREGETDGREYFFVTKEAFREMILKDQLIEYATYMDNYYGTPRSFVEEQVSSGKHVILEIEAQGASKIKQLYPDSVQLFVTPPNADILFRRLAGRGTETEEVIAGRMRWSAGEADLISHYDYLIVNDGLEESVKLIGEIVRCESCKPSRQGDFISRIRNELKNFKKGE